jgi:hypothetical protein
MANRPTAPVHPVIHIARAVAFAIGILAIVAQVPFMGALVAGLTAYAATLWLTRRSWPTGAPERTPR